MWVFVQDPSFEESFSAAYRQQVASAAGVPVTAVAITGIQASSVLVQTQVDLAVLTFRCRHTCSLQRNTSFACLLASLCIRAT